MRNHRDSSGDEMNLHLPQTPEAAIELREMVSVQKNLISPRLNSPIITLVQDSLLGIYRMSKPNVKFTNHNVMNLLSSMKHVTGMSEYGNTWSGQKLIEKTLPAISIHLPNKQFDDDKETKEDSQNFISITNGSYEKGIIDKNIVGKGTKGIIHTIHNQHGSKATADFLKDIQRLITECLLLDGFSVGISDLIADDSTKQRMIDVIRAKKEAVSKILKDIHLGVFENHTGKSDAEEFERKVNAELNKATEEAGKLGERSLAEDNRMTNMVKSGSKGKILNIAQMVACLGQQNVEGQRIRDGFTHRTLPHFNKFDDSPEARGFVENSFMNGLTPEEFFFHAMGGREGLIDTAVKTAETGYTQRQLLKAMEDFRVEHDYTVRNARGRIVQFVYGDDGFDPQFVESQSLPLVNMTFEQMKDRVMFSPKETFRTFCEAAVCKKLKEEKAWKKRMLGLLRQVEEDQIMVGTNILQTTYDTSVNYPVNFVRILDEVKHACHITPQTMCDITPGDIMDTVEYLSDSMSLYNKSSSQLTQVLLRYYLNPKTLMTKHRMTRSGLSMYVAKIEQIFQRACCDPGEFVGCIAAQSIGEPSTQLTLNSFTYETPIVVRRNGLCETQKIGDFVTSMIEHGKQGSTTIDYNKKTDTTFAPTPADDVWEVQAPNENGDIEWYKIEAGTQHPVVNEDGTDTMLRVTTHDSQEIVATKAKSFLKLVDGKLTQVRGDSLCVGDYVPVSTKTIDHEDTMLLDMETILSPSQYMFGSHAHKAMSLWNETQWWKKYNNKEFVLPYTRSDAFRDRMKPTRRGRVRKIHIEDGIVYPKQTSSHVSLIPEKIPLTYDFGYLVGAYCAEGCVTDTQVSISNNEESYFVPIQRWCDEHQITTKFYCTKNKNCEGWTSSDLRLYSKLLRDILVACGGKMSHGKMVLNKIVFSNTECKRGFLNAYFSGDGTVDTRTKSICATSCSYKLLNDVNVMMKTLGIMSYIRKMTRVTSNNRGTKSENIHQTWSLHVRNTSVTKLAEILCDSFISGKREKAVVMSEYKSKTPYLKHQLLIPNTSESGETTMEERNGRMRDVVFVPITSIEEVPNTTNYAYDLTVETTRNFLTENGLCIADTFHQAGKSSASAVTRGVPRLKEIIHVSKNPKGREMILRLRPQYRTAKEDAMRVKHSIETIYLRDILEKSAIYFDPKDDSPLLEADHAWMKDFREFERMIEDDEETPESSTDSTDEQKNTSVFVLRMIIDKEAMMMNDITMEEVAYHIGNDPKLSAIMKVMYSDDNHTDLIFRFRLYDETSKNSHYDNDDLKALMNLEKEIGNLQIRGIGSIKKVILEESTYLEKKSKADAKSMRTPDVVTGGFAASKEWQLRTDGSDFISILSHPAIDPRHVYSNDINHTLKYLGVEAARNVILEEIGIVIQDAYVNSRHLQILADTMTIRGELTPINRFGINSRNSGPLGKASFEETSEVFIKAGIFGEFDPVTGVSANIMVGQPIRGGTGFSDILFDEEEHTSLIQEGKK